MRYYWAVQYDLYGKLYDIPPEIVGMEMLPQKVYVWLYMLRDDQPSFLVKKGCELITQKGKPFAKLLKQIEFIP